MNSFIRVLDKYFNQTNNYTKCDNDNFKTYIEEYHPDTVSYHIKNMIGSRQDIVSSNARPTYVNHPFYIKFLDKRLR